MHCEVLRHLAWPGLFCIANWHCCNKLAEHVPIIASVQGAGQGLQAGLLDRIELQILLMCCIPGSSVVV